MTREEQICEGNPYWLDFDYENEYYYDSARDEGLHDGFIEGANWADKHPFWHNLEEDPNDLPLKEGNYLTVSNKDDSREPFIQHFFGKDENGEGKCLGEMWDCSGDGNVIAWMELPKFNL